MSKPIRGTNAHTRYFTADGARVPSVTTITGLLNKPALVPWANKLGLEGIDVTKYVDKAAEIGTCCHYLIQMHLQLQEPDLTLYSPDVVRQAMDCYQRFLDWEQGIQLKTILLETPLVHEEMRYGGTVDCYCTYNGKLTLVDFKTSGGIYPEMTYQVAAYRELLTANGHQVESVRILRVGRNETEGIEERTISETALAVGWEIFLNLYNIYQLTKKS